MPRRPTTRLARSAGCPRRPRAARGPLAAARARRAPRRCPWPARAPAGWCRARHPRPPRTRCRTGAACAESVTRTRGGIRGGGARGPTLTALPGDAERDHPVAREVPLVCVLPNRARRSVAVLVRLDRLAFAAGPSLLDGLVATVDGGCVVVVLVVGRLELGGGCRSHAVAEVEVRELRAQSLLAGDRAVDAVGVLPGRELKRLVGLVLDQDPPLVGRERRMDLLEPTVGVAPDGARLAAVEDLLAVSALQAQTDALGDPERHRRSDEEQHSQGLGDVVDRQVQLDRHEVVACREEEHDVHGDTGDADGGPGGGVARAVEQVVLALVA